MCPPIMSGSSVVRSGAAAPGAEGADPYYGGADGFDDVPAMIERAADGAVDHVRATLVA